MSHLHVVSLCRYIKTGILHCNDRVLSLPALTSALSSSKLTRSHSPSPFPCFLLLPVAGQLTQKSDVYAFGVMMLELLTGSPAVGEEEGPHAAEQQPQRQHLSVALGPFLRPKKPDVSLFIDRRLKEMGYSEEGALKLAVIAKCCIREDPKNRPNMTAVVKFLDEVDVK